MSGLGERDRPGAPNGGQPRDARSKEWLRVEGETEMVEVEGRGVRELAEVGDAEAVGAGGGVAARQPVTPRRAGADPVKALLHRHRDLCERAVDPLEIAAGLEAHGVTDRSAARFRHRDVFSLAEEMFARVSRDDETPVRPAPQETLRGRADWLLLTLLPGALCTGTVVGLHLTHGLVRLTVAVAGVLAVSLGVRAATPRGPLTTRTRTHPNSGGTWTYWLLAYALLGDGLLGAALSGGPDGLPDGTATAPWPLATAPALALTWACAPAAWSAHFFTVRARRKLAASRGLEDFAASVRPLLLGAVALFLVALNTLLVVSKPALDEPPPYAQTVTLGALLFLAGLLTVHGFVHAAKAVLATTAAAQATALATVFAARLPGCDVLAAPVRTITELWGPGSIQTLTCGAGALILLSHATHTLPRASAHAETEKPC